MAVQIKRSDIDDAKSKTIRSLLNLSPVSSNPRYPAKGGKFTFYLIDGETVHLPYMIAKSLKLSSCREYDYAEIDLAFTGTLRSHQVEICEQMLSTIQTSNALTLAVPPGSGKTVMGCWLACQLQLATVIIVHRIILFKQWLTSLTNNSDAKVWIPGVNDDIKEFNIIVCLSTRADAIPQEVKDSVGLLIVDEASHLCSPSMVSTLLAWHPKYILLETATPTRSDGLHAMLYALAGTKSIVSPLLKHFTVTKVKTGCTGVNRDEEGKYSYSILEKSLVEDVERNKLIVELVLSNKNRKILILSKRVEHTKTLCSLLEEVGITADYLAGSKNTYTESSVLVGTIPKIGVGFDEANACDNYSGQPVNTLILASSIKSLEALEQNIGRVFRAEDPQVLHLVDDDSVILKHWRIAKKWYKSVGAKVIE